MSAELPGSALKCTLFFLRFIYSVFCQHVCCRPEGTRSHFGWLWGTMRLLGIELRICGRTASVLWAISPAPGNTPLDSITTLPLLKSHRWCKHYAHLSVLNYVRGLIHVASVKKKLSSVTLLLLLAHIMLKTFTSSIHLESSVLRMDLHTEVWNTTWRPHTWVKALDCLSSPTAFQVLPQVLPIWQHGQFRFVTDHTG